MSYDRDDYRDRQSYGRGDRGNEYGRREERLDDRGYSYGGQRDFARQGGDQDRGFVERAGNEVRSWFGDDDAEHRRERDDRSYGEHSRPDHSRGQARDANRSSGGTQGRQGGFMERVSNWFDDGDRDQGRGRNEDHSDYHHWRQRQMQELDRDYHEYRRESQTKFDSDFGAWRTGRQTQRSSLSQVQEHFEVVGSDGEHIGTVDKVRGDNIILTKSDSDAGGHHHSVPSRWLQSVEGKKVTLSKTAAEAKHAWRDTDGNGAMFGDTQNTSQGAHVLNRSFSGTYE